MQCELCCRECNVPFPYLGQQLCGTCLVRSIDADREAGQKEPQPGIHKNSCLPQAFDKAS